MKEFYTVVFLLLIVVGVSTIVKLWYDFVMRCKEALRIAERLDSIDVIYQLRRLNDYVDEQKQKEYYASKLWKVGMKEEEDA